MEAVRRLINSSSGNINNGRSSNITGGVVIFSKSSCCMCYTVKVLFHELGVNPMVHEIDQMNQEGKEIEKALKRLGCKTSVPAVFIGGILVGSTNEVMSLHLSGSLLPLIRPYRLLQYPSTGRPPA